MNRQSYRAVRSYKASGNELTGNAVHMYLMFVEHRICGFYRFCALARSRRLFDSPLMRSRFTATKLVTRIWQILPMRSGSKPAGSGNDNVRVAEAASSNRRPSSDRQTFQFMLCRRSRCSMQGAMPWRELRDRRSYQPGVDLASIVTHCG